MAFEPGVGTVLPHALGSPIRAKKVYFTLPDGLQPAYYVELNVGTKGTNDSDYYSYVVSAHGRLGAVPQQPDRGRRVHLPRVGGSQPRSSPSTAPWARLPPRTPRARPDRYQAPYVPANVITLQNTPFSRNDPWLPTGATQTTGNNVDAYADLGAPDGFQPESDLRPSTTAPGVFDYTYDVTKSPSLQLRPDRKAATTHLFYVNNFLHDWFYDAGFDEASGNAQIDELRPRRPGERQPSRAEAQDYGGRNNANMSTPADGCAAPHADVRLRRRAAR